MELACNSKVREIDRLRESQQTSNPTVTVGRTPQMKQKEQSRILSVKTETQSRNMNKQTKQNNRNFRQVFQARAGVGAYSMSVLCARFMEIEQIRIRTGERYNIVYNYRYSVEYMKK